MIWQMVHAQSFVTALLSQLNMLAASCGIFSRRFLFRRSYVALHAPLPLFRDLQSTLLLAIAGAGISDATLVDFAFEHDHLSLESWRACFSADLLLRRDFVPSNCL